MTPIFLNPVPSAPASSSSQSPTSPQAKPKVVPVKANPTLPANVDACLRVNALENALGYHLCQKLVDYSPVPASLLLKTPQRLSSVVDQYFDTSGQVLRVMPTIPLAFQTAPLARYQMGAGEALRGPVDFHSHEVGARRSRTEVLRDLQTVADAIDQTEQYMSLALNPVADDGLPYTAYYARSTLRGFLSIPTDKLPERFSKIHLFSLSWAAWLHGLDLIISPNQRTLRLLRCQPGAPPCPAPQRP